MDIRRVEYVVILTFLLALVVMVINTSVADYEEEVLGCQVQLKSSSSIAHWMGYTVDGNGHNASLEALQERVRWWESRSVEQLLTLFHINDTHYQGMWLDAAQRIEWQRPQADKNLTLRFQDRIQNTLREFQPLISPSTSDDRGRRILYTTTLDRTTPGTFGRARRVFNGEETSSILSIVPGQGCALSLRERYVDDDMGGSWHRIHWHASPPADHNITVVRYQSQHAFLRLDGSESIAVNVPTILEFQVTISIAIEYEMLYDLYVADL